MSDWSVGYRAPALSRVKISETTVMPSMLGMLVYSDVTSMIKAAGWE